MPTRSSAIHGQLTIRFYATGRVTAARAASTRGRAAQRNFDTYRSLRIHEMPKVEVHIVPSTVAPTGEPANAPRTN